MKPLGFVEYQRQRYASMVSEYGISHKEAVEAYPESALRLEWERMLSDCAVRREIFSRQLLQSLTPHMQHGINRLSKGASIPSGYVIPQNERNG